MEVVITKLIGKKKWSCYLNHPRKLHLNSLLRLIRTTAPIFLPILPPSSLFLEGILFPHRKIPVRRGEPEAISKKVKEKERERSWLCLWRLSFTHGNPPSPPDYPTSPNNEREDRKKKKIQGQKTSENQRNLSLSISYRHSIHHAPPKNKSRPRRRDDGDSSNPRPCRPLPATRQHIHRRRRRLLGR